MLSSIRPNYFQLIDGTGLSQSKQEGWLYAAFKSPCVEVLQGPDYSIGLHRYFSTNPKGVPLRSLEFHFQKMVVEFCIGLVPVNKAGSVYIIYHQVQVAVIVQVTVRGAIAERRLSEPQRVGPIAVCPLPRILKCVVLEGSRRDHGNEVPVIKLSFLSNDLIPLLFVR